MFLLELNVYIRNSHLNILQYVYFPNQGRNIYIYLISHTYNGACKQQNNSRENGHLERYNRDNSNKR